MKFRCEKHDEEFFIYCDLCNLERFERGVVKMERELREMVGPVEYERLLAVARTRLR